MTITTYNIRPKHHWQRSLDAIEQIIHSQVQTHSNVERVWKNCKTSRIAGIVAGVYASEFENACSIAHFSMELTWRLQPSA
jgi:hypothetical protein